MDSLDDLKMQTLLSRTNTNITETNKIHEIYKEQIQTLSNLDKCNENMSKKVNKAFIELREKENDIRCLEIEKETLTTKLHHIDESIKNKLSDIEKFKKPNEEIINETEKIHSDFYEEMRNYQAAVSALGNKYKESAKFFNEDFVTTTLQETEISIQNLMREIEEAKEKSNVLENELINLKENIPDLVEIVEKKQLLKELERVTSELKEIQKTSEEIVTKQSTLNPDNAEYY